MIDNYFGWFTLYGEDPMPSKSLKQKKFMSAAAHNPEFAAKAGIPVKVAKEFHNADTGKYGHKARNKRLGKAKL